MSPAGERSICLVTGTGGYLGGRVKAALEARGWDVVALTRRPGPGASAIRFSLGEDLSPARLPRADALVHCAWDFMQRRWEDEVAVNVRGSEALLAAARAAGVPRLVFLSSLSAHAGARSHYGRAKLAVETAALDLGAAVIRPGLVHGDPPGSMFARLVRQVDRARVLPLLGGGDQIQFLVHEDDLCDFACRCVAAGLPPGTPPVSVAHEQPWSLKQLLGELARSRGRTPVFVPVPWRLGWAALRLAEVLSIRASFRSDSLLGLVYSNPSPSFQEQRRLGVSCRPFRITPP